MFSFHCFVELLILSIRMAPRPAAGMGIFMPIDADSPPTLQIASDIDRPVPPLSSVIEPHSRTSPKLGILAMIFAKSFEVFPSDIEMLYGMGRPAIRVLGRWHQEPTAVGKGRLAQKQ